MRRPLDPCGLGAAAVLAGFHAVANKWDAVEALPAGLDVTQAVVYREVDGVEQPLGGRWLVWPDQVVGTS